MSLDRRDFLKTVAVGGAATGVAWPTAALAATPAYDRTLPAGETYPVDPALLPFGHGVMSGDPLPDRVMLWTRIGIPDARGMDATLVPDPQGITTVIVGWVLARDRALTDVIRRGTVTTSAVRDWTVKVDADQLPAATTLFYAFTALGFRSPIGRTRTAPAAGDTRAELTIANIACTSWWQDVFNAYARIGARDDLDLITHAGDHIYDGSGGHPASRFWKGQTRWNDDIDNRDMASVAECRRRYALYYQDPALVRAHLAAPFAIMPDQHDDDAAANLTQLQALTIFWEWTASRAPRPDGTGTFAASPGPDVNVPAPSGTNVRYLYRSLPYGGLAEIVLIDNRRFADRAGDVHKVLGDQQNAWLQGALLDTQARGVRFRAIVNQVNLSQLRAFNVPAASAFAQQFGIDVNAPQGEIYTVAWGGRPTERAELFRFLRSKGIVDNVVLSGDSHGFFGYDLTEDPELPAYQPVTGTGTLAVVGVEMISSAMGRPGGQDVVAETLNQQRKQQGRGSAFTTASEYDSIDRPAALPATLALEEAAKAANPNLRYFNWKAEFGYSMLHIRPEKVVLECFTTPQRSVSPDQRLLTQLESLRGVPHLTPVSQPTPVRGTRQDPRPGEPVVTAADAPAAVVPEVPTAVALPVAAAAIVGGMVALRRRRDSGA